MSVPGTDLQNWPWLRGRARRREYWLWLLVILAWMQVLGASGDALAMQVLSWALMFAMVRRLHDVGLGADWMLVVFLVAMTLLLHAIRTSEGGVAIAGGLVIVAGVVGLGLAPGQPSDNRFGSPSARRRGSPAPA